jgi:hypothetical protein
MVAFARLPKPEVQEAVHSVSVLTTHGFPVKSAEQVGEWRRAFKKGTPPPEAVAHYRELIGADDVPRRTDLGRKEALAFYLGLLADALADRGYLPPNNRGAR